MEVIHAFCLKEKANAPQATPFDKKCQEWVLIRKAKSSVGHYPVLSPVHNTIQNIDQIQFEHENNSDVVGFSNFCGVPVDENQNHATLAKFE